MELPRYQPITSTQTRILMLEKTQDGRLSARHQIIDIRKAAKSFRKHWKAGYNYEALSYYWGDPTPVHTILLNGVETKIHDNLYNALQVLTKQRPGIPLWTDAICIDQTNSQERSSQIQLMFQIYRNASHVWAWLGECCSGDGVGEAIRYLPLLCQIGEEYTEMPLSFKISENRLPKPGEPFWEGLSQILFNFYFDRLWIIQETAVALQLTFLIGYFHVSLKDMNRLFKIASKLKRIKGFPTGLPFSVNESMFYIRSSIIWDFKDNVERRMGATLKMSTWRLPKRRHDAVTTFIASQLKDIEADALGSLLSLSGRQKCTDPRDRIFALLGLVQHCSKLPMQHPWSDNASIEEVYLEAFYYLAPFSNLSELLTLAAGNTIRDGGLSLPSWCPNFSHRVEDKQKIIHLGDSPLNGAGASRANPVIERGPDPNVLKLQGTEVGSIVFVCSFKWSLVSVDIIASSDIAATDAVYWLDHCWNAVIELLPFFAEVDDKADTEADARQIHWQEALRTHFWCTLVAYHSRPGIIPQLWPADFDKFYCALKQMIEIGADSDSRFAYWNGLPQSCRIIHALMALVLEDTTFFIARGRQTLLLGIGTSTMSVGDNLWVLKGSALPSILRGPYARNGEASVEGGQEGSFWKYGGEAYVHQIMNGEAETEGHVCQGTPGVVNLI